jgi:hypothetical protein
MVIYKMYIVSVQLLNEQTSFLSESLVRHNG